MSGLAGKNMSHTADPVLPLRGSFILKVGRLRFAATDPAFFAALDAKRRQAAARKAAAAAAKRARLNAARRERRRSAKRREAFSYINIVPYTTRDLAFQIEAWGTWSLHPTCAVLAIFTPDLEFVKTVARLNLNGLGAPLKLHHYDTPEHGVKHAIWVGALRAAFLAMRASLSPAVCPAHRELFRVVGEIRRLNHQILHTGWVWRASRVSSLQLERNALLQEARERIRVAKDTCPVRKAAREKDGLVSFAANSSTTNGSAVNNAADNNSLPTERPR